MIDRRVKNKYSGGYRLDRLVEQMRVRRRICRLVRLTEELRLLRILGGGVVGGESDNAGTGLEGGEDGFL